MAESTKIEERKSDPRPVPSPWLTSMLLESYDKPNVSLRDILKPLAVPSTMDLDKALREGIRAVLDVSERNQLTDKAQTAILATLLAVYSESRLFSVLRDYFEPEKDEESHDPLSYIFMTRS